MVISFKFFVMLGCGCVCVCVFFTCIQKGSFFHCFRKVKTDNLKKFDICWVLVVNTTESLKEDVVAARFRELVIVICLLVQCSGLIPVDLVKYCWHASSVSLVLCKSP